MIVALDQFPGHGLDGKTPYPYIHIYVCIYFNSFAVYALYPYILFNCCPIVALVLLHSSHHATSVTLHSLRQQLQLFVYVPRMV